MKKSSVIYNFAISQQQGKILLTAQEYPWSVLQVITFEPQYFDKVVALCKRRGIVATPRQGSLLLHHPSWQWRSERQISR